MRQSLIVAIFVAIAVDFALAAEPKPVGQAASAQSPVVLKSYRWGRWLVQETANFRVYCLPEVSEARKFPEVCEALRTQLQQTWLGNSQLHQTLATWTPRCDIVLYPTVAEYSRKLGPGSEQSSGCASIEMEKGRVVTRRVDLRADAADWLTAALPHELTHVIVADRFSRKQLPRWADEGMAILAEPEFKRVRRYHELQNALAKRTYYRTAELVQLQSYPAADYRDAFYGQSASLVSHLVQRDTPERFLDFVERAMEQGYDRALQECYGMKSIAALQTEWQPRLVAREQSPVLLAEGITRITSAMEAGRLGVKLTAVP